MKARRWVRTTVALSVGLVGLIGCAAAPDSVTAAAAMPLDPYLRPADAPAPPSTPEEAAAARSVVEDAVAACMAERGFHYVPYVPPATGAEYAPASRDWSAQWGYGLVARVRPAADSQDPNPAIRAALSASEQGGWDDAMSGSVVGEQAVPGSESVAAQAFPASSEPSVLAAPPAIDGAVPVEKPATVTVGDAPVPTPTSAAEIDENGYAHEPGFDAAAAAAAADQAAQAQAAAEAAEAAATQLTTEEPQSVPVPVGDWSR
ncbi:hypothetical protein FDO65_14595 [Nakamurella flava]|uniref:Lipoprotein n=1 Tax=Nakamurella flava TaxID=2576308 RepID=A0A4U6QF83_9ACTN|nr:hypothetical protein [Nakamurella flava]TKV58741.1 hypothetical protein FDO65_14595 [Nakamurella flava]